MVTLFLIGQFDFDPVGTIDWICEPYTYSKFYIKDSIVQELILNNTWNIIGMHKDIYKGSEIVTKEWNMSEKNTKNQCIVINEQDNGLIGIVDNYGHYLRVPALYTTKNLLNRTENGFKGIIDFRCNHSNGTKCMNEYKTFNAKVHMLGYMTNMEFKFSGNEVLLSKCIMRGGSGIILPRFITVLCKHTIECDTNKTELNEGLRIISHGAFTERAIKNELYIPSTVELICPGAFIPASEFQTAEIKKENNRIDCLVAGKYLVKNIGNATMFTLNKIYGLEYVSQAIVHGRKYC